MRYYSFENLDTGEYQGLLRLNDRIVERAGPDGWELAAIDQERLAFPGADGPDLIDSELARQLVRRRRRP